MQREFRANAEGFLNPWKTGIERAEGTVAQVVQVRSLAPLLETPRCKQRLPAQARDASPEGRVAGGSSDPQPSCIGADRAARARNNRMLVDRVHFH